MTHQLSLNGDWLLKDFYGEDWHWRNSHMPNSHDVRGWRPATIPGSIYADLLKNGEIPDPYVEMNSRLVEWVPARTWLFKRTFEVDTALRGQRCWLRFEGIDYEAEVFLNGVSLGTHRGMYTPAEFEITDTVQFGAENLVVVAVERAPDEYPQAGRTSRVHTHKSRMSYWWDFCPRMIQIGIWDSVALHFSRSVRIEDVFVQPKLNVSFDKANINVTVELGGEGLQLECDLIYADQVIASTRQSIGGTTLHTFFELDQPHLWWPNGYGEQALYSVNIRILDAAGNEADSRQVTFGIRQLDFVPNEGAPADARPYTLVVNGQKMYINGWNWVPKDVMYGLPQPEKLGRLLTLAQHAHVNLLRVWGGGLIETEAFYALCDRLGILVWQEFILSSSGIENLPPDDPAYIEMILREAEQIVPRKRNHPSLAVWCGGNELQYGEERPIDEAHPFIAALQTALKRLDPDRPFLPTSACGRVFSFSLENMKRDPAALQDVHGPWEHQGLTGQYALYNQVHCLLHSEFGAEGLTNLRTLEQTISAQNHWPVTLNNPVWEHRGAWWVKEPSWRTSLGERANLPELVQGTQFLQAEAVRYAVEAHSRDRYHNSGVIPWQFNEPYPMAACTSAVDYYGQPKPLYYAIARAYEPLHLSAEFATQSWLGRDQFEAQLWVTNSGQSYEAARLDARLINAKGVVLAQLTQPVSVPANVVQSIGTFHAPLTGNLDLTDVFLLDLALKVGETTARTQYVFTRAETLAPLYALPTTQLRVEQRAGGVTITNTGDHVALLVWLEDGRDLTAAGFVYFEDNYFCLLPGEQRIVLVSWRDVPQAERQVRIRAWNTNALVIKAWDSD
ncbi:MAG: beta-mannosidase [Aggregatilineales bacterium]